MQQTYPFRNSPISRWLLASTLALAFILTSPFLAGAADIKVEAEAAQLNGVVISTTLPGYSGTGYVEGFDAASDNIGYTFNATAGLYELTIVYTSPYGPKGYDLQVNAEKGGGTFTMAAGFATTIGGKFLLKEGANTVVIGNGWGYFGVDYITFSPTTVTAPVKPPKTLTDPLATSSTKALFSYMVDLYGSKVLSSQYEDVNYILEQTGKNPAIGAFDLIEYSPSRIQFGANPAGTSERHIAWAKQDAGNGIISLMWHWNAPTDLINQAPDKLWWSGFYTTATTFDLGVALADKTSERYKLLIRDIDSIAVQLKKFRDADIPVLWRPLHEAPGGWFWWGAKGAAPFKELWRIMYDRLTTHHQLHNLIWVYTSTTDMDWYPGDAYVDMVGLDIYTDASSNMSGDWTAMQTLFGGKKMVALSESGTLPDPAKIRGYGTWWSWFAVWSGTYIRNQSISLLKSVFTDVDVITRDELPNWRTYGNTTPTVSITSPVNGATIVSGSTISLQAAASTPSGSVSKVEFFRAGVKIGEDATAPYQYSWTNAAAGTYSLQAKVTTTTGATALSSLVSVLVYTDMGNLNPVAVLTASPTSGTIPLVVAFNASGSTDGNNDPLSFSWNFGDNTSGTGATPSHTYTAAGSYVATLTVSDGKGGSATKSVTITASPIITASSLKVQYRVSNANATDNAIQAHFKLVNTGAQATPYSELKLRYWYTNEGGLAQNFWCDWAQLGSSNVSGKFVKLATPVASADNYLEISFGATAGSLVANGNSGEIQTRFSKTNWSNYNEVGDYSFDPTKTAYTDWSKVTLYRNGVLVWGTPPAGAAKAIHHEASVGNTFSARLYPNPTPNGQVRLQLDGIVGKSTIRIRDLQGQLKKQQEIGEAQQVELSLSLTPGVYVVEIQNATKTILKKLVVY